MRNLPNLLTLSRIVMTFPVIILLRIDTTAAIWGSGIVFAVAALTDYFDGYLARKYDIVTRMGKFLDQLSDKILVTGIFIALFAAGLVNFWLLIIIVFRDILVSGIRMLSASSGIVIPPDMMGKAKTVVHFAFIAVAYFHLLFDFPSGAGMVVLQVVVGAVTVASGMNYLLRHRKTLIGGD